MKINARDNIAKFFYDCGKVAFTVLVIGVMAKKPLIPADALLGLTYTFILFIMGVRMDHMDTVKEKFRNDI